MRPARGRRLAMGHRVARPCPLPDLGLVQALAAQHRSLAAVRCRLVLSDHPGRYRRAVTAKGHFPTQQAALKTLYLVTRGLDPKGTGQARWTMRWKPALNAFAVTFADRMPAAENL